MDKLLSCVEKMHVQMVKDLAKRHHEAMRTAAEKKGFALSKETALEFEITTDGKYSIFWHVATETKIAAWEELPCLEVKDNSYKLYYKFVEL